MRAMTAILVPAIAAGTVWAGGEATADDVLSPGIVRLTGTGGAAPAATTGPARIFPVDVSGGPAANAHPAGPPAIPQIPEGARWPDDHDRITARSGRGGRPEAQRAPNPWEVRLLRGAREEVAITCGGIILADGGESVALLNGRVARTGSVIGALTVSCIARDAVVLEANGSYFAIPRGRRVTIEL